MANNGVTITINAETKEALSRLKEFFGAGSEGLERMTRAGDFLKEMGSRIAGALTIGAVVEFTRETINAAEGLKILSREAGFSIKLLSGIREEAIRTRDGFEGVSQSLVFFSRQLGQAVRMGGPVMESFRQLIGKGSLASFAGGGESVDQVLLETVSALNQMTDPTQKAAMAAEVFGRGWRDALLALGSVKGELREGAITAEMAENAAKFNETLREIKASIEELFVAIATRLLPKLQEVATWFKEMAAGGGELRDKIEMLGLSVAMGLTAGVAKGILDLELLLFSGLIRLAGEVTVWMDGMVTGMLNKIINKINANPAFGRIFGKSIQEVHATTQEEVDAQGTEQIAYLTKAAENLKAMVTEFFDSGIGAAKELSKATGDGRGGAGELIARGTGEQFGPSQPGKAPLSEEAKSLLKDVEKAYQEASAGKIALLDEEEKQLKEKIDKEVLDLQTAEAEKAKVTETYSRKRAEVIKEETAAELEVDMARVLGKRHLVENDPTATTMEKKLALLATLAEENRLLQKNIALNEQRTMDLNLTPEARLLASKQLQELQQRRAENNLATGKLTREGTFGGEFGTMLTGLKEQWGSWAKEAAEGFKNVFGAAVQSISDGITGLIMGTKSWGQALNEIGMNIGTSLVGAIVKMGVQWVATQLVMMLFGKALMASSIAAMTPLALAASAVWAGPATLSAIATDGASAAAAPEEIFAAQGITLAGSIAQFEQGGFTGAAGGMVHPNEFVFSAPAVRRIGLGNLEAMHEGGKAGRSDTPINIHLAALNNESHVPNWVRTTQGEAIIFDVVRKNFHRLT